MKLVPILLIGAAFAASAHAADNEQNSSEWTMLGESNGKAIYSTESNAPALVIGCNDAGKISATFALDGDVEAKLASRSSRTRRLNGTLTVEGNDSATSKWAFLPTRNMASPVENKYARRLYNAAISGKSVTLDLGRRGSFEYSPPALNADFQAFAAGCIAK